MKTNIGKVISTLATLLLVVNSNIYAYELNGIKYSVSGAWSYSAGKNVYHATVEKSNYSGDITIPDKVFLTFTDGGGNERADTLSVTAIATQAFKDCANLTSIAFEGPIRINKAAFTGCRGLTSLNFENQNVHIGTGAFQNCSNLKSIYLGKDVTLLDYDSPFLNDSLVEIFQIYLEGGGSLLSATNTARYATSSFRKYLKKAIIVDGSKIIGQESFLECINLDTIIIPNTVSELGSSAFKACKSLNAINLKDNDIETIPNYCFFNCINLKSCELPHHLTKIGQEAFAFCRNLDSLIIPQSVSQVGKMAFKECTNILSIDLSNNDLTSIPEYCFSECKNLKTFYCPNNLKEIGYEAFYGDTALKRVILPLSVTSVESLAFSGCKNLTICVPKSASIESNAFKNCKKVIYYTDRMGDYWFRDSVLTGYTGTETELHLPASHNGSHYVIGSVAFANLETKITSVHVPSSVKSIWANAFKDCKSLKSVVLPADLTDIATTAFTGCDSISSVTMGMHAETPSFKSIFASSKNKTLKEIVLQEGSTIMGTKKGGSNYLIFANDTVLESVTIPYTVNVVADSAFMNCKHLRSIAIGSFSAEGDEPINIARRVRNGHGINPDEIVADIYVGISTFENDTEAEYITWNYIKNIASKAFKGCTGLTECIIPNTVTNIDYEAFANCTGLKVVKIPSSVEKISNYAFMGCSGMEDLIIECNPSAFITSDGSTPSQFKECNHIKSLQYNSCRNGSMMIPSITTLFSSALPSIEKLEFLPGSDEIYWNSGVYTLADDLIGEMPKLSKVTIPEGVQYISFGAFKGCTLLKQIDLPNSLKTIANRAFKNCGLERILLPMGVTSIDNDVLRECLNLEEVEIGCVDMKTIPVRFCAECPNLKHVHYLYYGHKHCLPTEIASEAFSGCPSLKKITIPESVEIINGSAYDNCTGVEQLVVEAKTPPICYSWPTIPFNGINRQNTLCVPKGEKESYSNADVWKTFFDNIYYDWEATMLQREQEISAEVEANTAVISWTEENNAGSYDLTLNEVGTESSPQTFTIPSYTAGNNGPMNSPRKIQNEGVNGIKFTVEGLKQQTAYNYSLLVRDTNRNVLNTHWGTFSTLDIETAIENFTIDLPTIHKVLHNGQIFILRGEKEYTLTGQEVK